MDHAPLASGSGFRPIKTSLYYIQRLVALASCREAVSQSIAAVIRHIHGVGPEWTDDEAEGEAVASIERDGLALLPSVPTHRVDELLTFFDASEVVGPAARLMPLERVPAGTAIADYPLKTVLACPGLLEIINAPVILRIAARHLGCKPTLSSLWVRWSLPSGTVALPSIQSFHRDTEDWRFVKLFVYLTDVDTDAGPHVFVKTSHKYSGTLRARSLTAADVEKRYGAAQLAQAEGSRGTSFMTDAFGIHKGMPPLRLPRLMLQAQYSLLPCFARQYQPVAMTDPPVLDPYVNRLLLASERAVRAAAVC